MRPSVLAGLLVASFVAGCAAIPTPTTPTTNKVQALLNVACPALKALPSSVNLTATQQKYLSAVLAVCPPNPPPLNTTGAGVDILTALAALGYIP